MKRARGKRREFRGLVWHADWHLAVKGNIGRLEMKPWVKDYSEWWVEVVVREVRRVKGGKRG